MSNNCGNLNKNQQKCMKLSEVINNSTKRVGIEKNNLYE